MTSPPQVHVIVRLLVIVLAGLAVPSAARASTDAVLFPLFLATGPSIVSYGEYARVDDQVIFSMVVGGSAEHPRLHPVSLPANLVDWPRTERHAASARYQRYTQTRGEEDFLRLSNDVAAVLNQVLLTKDRTRAMEIARQARATLAGWPREHFGYRQHDVREIVAVVDAAISGLSAESGVRSFELDLVAMAPVVELEPMVGMPSAREQIDQAFHVAALVTRAPERVALLQSALLLLHEAGPSIPSADAAALRRTAETQIRFETALDARYNQLVRRLMSRATRAAAGARVGDVERVLDRIPDEDARLGRRRPEVVQALRASVRAQLEAARRLRLLRDQWNVRRSLYREYQRAAGTQVRQLVKLQPALDAIRRLEGPAPESLLALQARLRGGVARLERVHPPTDLRAAHDLLIGAWRFAESAASSRYEAVKAGNLNTAWEASSAAAGALLLLTRAQQEIRTLLEPPQLP